MEISFFTQYCIERDEKWAPLSIRTYLDYIFLDYI